VIPAAQAVHAGAISMANLSTPFGFRHFGYLEGAAPTYGVSVRRIAAANGTAIFRGDAVVSLNTGYITQSTAGSTIQTAGIFQGCEYFSTSQQTKIRSKYWPGSDATGDVTAFLIDSPTATFIVQSNGTAFTLANVGNNIDIAQTQAGNTLTGYSGQQAGQSTIGVTATLPFRIIRLASDVLPAGSNGSDNTTNFNMAIVTFNNQDFRSLTGI
jgi:hypothetical protein